MIPINPTTTINVELINTGYLDKCLEHYIFQRLNQGISNENTCFLKHVINNGCIGWIDSKIEFDLEEKKRYLKKRSIHKSKFNNEVKYLKKMIRRDDGSVFSLSNNVFRDDHKIIKSPKTN